MKHALTAIIYAYGADTPDWGGIQQQIQRCWAYAEQHHICICKVVTENAWHGPLLTRPVFGPLFAALTSSADHPDYLLVTLVDRIECLMDLKEGLYFEPWLRRAGVSVLAVDETLHSDTVLRNIMRNMKQEIQQKLEEANTRMAARAQRYCHFIAHGGWPAVNPVDGMDGFGYRRFQLVAPGHYVPAPEDLPHGEGVLLPGPANELRRYQRFIAWINTCCHPTEPLIAAVQRHLGDDWTPSRALVMLEDPTLTRIGVDGWELLTPGLHGILLDAFRGWVISSNDEVALASTPSLKKSVTQYSR